MPGLFSNNPQGPRGWLSDNSAAFMLGGLGLAGGGLGGAMYGAIQGAGMDRDRRKERDSRKALEALMRSPEMAGMSPGVQGWLSKNPDAAGQVLGQRLQPQEQQRPNYTEAGGYMFNEDTGEWIEPPGGIQDDPVKIGAITTLRKDYENQPGTSRYRQTVPILNSMSQAVTDNSAMSDVDFVYGMAQIFDPDSVVRETEMGFVLDSQSMPAALKGQLQKILEGKAALGPQVRRDLVNSASRRVQQYRTQAESEANQFGGIADRNKINRQDIMRDLEPMPEPLAPATMGGPQPGMIEDGYRFKGGDPRDPNNWEPVL